MSDDILFAARYAAFAIGGLVGLPIVARRFIAASFLTGKWRAELPATAHDGRTLLWVIEMQFHRGLTARPACWIYYTARDATQTVVAWGIDELIELKSFFNWPQPISLICSRKRHEDEENPVGVDMRVSADYQISASWIEILTGRKCTVAVNTDKGTKLHGTLYRETA